MQVNINDIEMCAVIRETPNEYFNAEYKSLVGRWDGSTARNAHFERRSAAV